MYANGARLGTHEGGHLPYAFELTGRVPWGEVNTFAISVENHPLPERVSARLSDEAARARVPGASAGRT